MNLPAYLCPDCGNALPATNILQGQKTVEAHGRCSQCNKWVAIPLPSIRKKLVYVDQSLLSAVCLDPGRSRREVLLLSKLRELKDRQKIFLVVSDIHSRETSAIPDAYVEDRKKLWRFQNDLAGGSISADLSDVFVAQNRRALAEEAESDSFPVSDIGIDDPHRLKVGMQVQLTNHWRQKLHLASAPPRLKVNEEFRRIIERQLENIPSCKNVRDCLNFVRELWHEDIRRGIAACRQQRDLMQSLKTDLDAGRMIDIRRLEAPDTPFRRIVGEVVHGLDEESALRRWLELIGSDSTDLCAAAKIRTAFEAVLLWNWRTASPPTNPNTFNVGFGLSRQNDIDHISVFAPYVDALTTDNGMFDLCKHEIVAAELAQFSCRIFSTKNYTDFEVWLDALLVEPEMPIDRAR